MNTQTNISLPAIQRQTFDAITELLTTINLAPGKLLVIGCSSSEITGQRVGTASSPDVGRAVLTGALEATTKHGIHLAAQCCEHLNRALVINQEVAAQRDYTQVNARPIPKAGGSFAAAAYEDIADAIVVESIAADAGIDIGFTLIGMHLKAVASPVRLTHNKIGATQVIAARTRPKYIGGSRTVYDDNLAHAGTTQSPMQS